MSVSPASLPARDGEDIQQNSMDATIAKGNKAGVLELVARPVGPVSYRYTPHYIGYVLMCEPDYFF